MSLGSQIPVREFVSEAFDRGILNYDIKKLVSAHTISEVFNYLRAIYKEPFRLASILLMNVNYNIEEAQKIRSSWLFRFLRFGRNSLNKRIQYTQVLFNEALSEIQKYSSIYPHRTESIIEREPLFQMRLSTASKLSIDDFGYLRDDLLELSKDVILLSILAKSKSEEQI